MNLYEQLGVGQSATADDIKRAYFRMTRKHSPEKDPAAFMRIREAYETLTSEAAKAEYDKKLTGFMGMPPGAAEVVMEADRLMSKHLEADAAILLESCSLTGAEKDAADSFLCSLYLDMGNSGKAVRIAEALVEKYPGNALYLRQATDACRARGWDNRARSYAERLEQLVPQDEGDLLSGLDGSMFHHPRYYADYIEKLEKGGKSAPVLSAFAFGCSLRGGDDDKDDDDEYDYEYDYVQLSLDLGGNVVGAEHQWEDPLFAAKKFASHTKDAPRETRGIIRDVIKDFILIDIYLKDRYDLLPHIKEAIENVSAHDIFETAGYKTASMGYEALQAINAGVPKSLAAHSLMSYWLKDGILSKADLQLCRDEILAREADILMLFPGVRPQIRRYLEEFPAIADHSAEFLRAALRFSDETLYTEMNKRFRKLSKVTTGFDLDWMGEDEILDSPYTADEPPVRQEPVRVVKIGRNEPCPCGSGKKYKKCCGA